ncbi:adenylate/guanylate cyclase domain-containing protein [Corynebacterium sp. ES2794-CONJ1]|uniref:adenylate/guanylate cyclase domain-containing protein n=1 Tax=unclassified Corynebacterium TaxID=2624378 RepID=UPI002167D6A3|nr:MULTISPECIES: adenylate/guanylate cyclase domain-containing protein [unclassified Corynebacterium]MCS4490333.1 adenylate/guanylate cyclase domain-containing protein [Corynebacterium sp. ES2775-CONJ]MCS4492111.1 adenylate/guanylate cyclase domain-containing protein [Corynebacterium sp. ES2715-CONJ3]MCS4532405.1 adenylate/guanylate cyclase domain-containing protein [Corynebacterium sp. ES2730-CONJ]MCU9519632.1 adenylate/guanylate cyclase domain-containing protein [Corynebacterium sp. ES2794-CO
MEKMWGFVSWLAKTSWPLYTATIISSNLLAAIGIMAFVNVLLPVDSFDILAQAPHMEPIGSLLLITAVTTGTIATFILFRPIFDWQRDPDRHDPNMVRNLVMRIPFYQTAICVLFWALGTAIMGFFSARTSPKLAVVLVVSMLFTTLMAAMFTYLESERIVRPIAAAAMARRFEDSTLEPPIKFRLRLTWALTSAIPILGILLLLVGHRYGYFLGRLDALIPAIAALAIAALTAGFLGTTLVIMSVVDPIVELKAAINKVRHGDTDVQVDIYDGSEIGSLQAGFNEMMRGLKERQRVRDIFGRYVGIEVARRALEERPELGGENREVAVLFVDVIGSTTFAVDNDPQEVVEELNRFFEHVVEVVHRNKGFINKFQGDAALAVFGAPLALSDYAGHALQAARELRQGLKGMRLEAGIGVTAGTVVAGHIGGQNRFEYTVIGDAVNAAARLTEIAKDTPGAVITNAATLRLANEAEQARWTLMKSVELRGRNAMTQLARPIRPTLADRS